MTYNDVCPSGVESGTIAEALVVGATDCEITGSGYTA